MDEERGTRGHGSPATGENDGAASHRGGPGSPLAGANGEGRKTGTPPGEGAPAPGETRSRRKRRKAPPWWVELPILLVLALVLALLIKSFVIQAFFIPSGSMENTLEIGDKVLVNKLVYDFRPIHRGDIVVFNGEGSWNQAPVAPTPPQQRLWNAITGLFGTAPGVHDYIKRVIGLPGDHVACCNVDGQVTVNGVALSEKSYLYPGNAPSAKSFSVTVPQGDLWVMGDHRSISYDSRGHIGDPGGGAIPEDKVVGRAFVIVWPTSRWRVLPIPATFEQPKLAAAGAAAGLAAAGARAGHPASLAAATAPAWPGAPLAPLALGVVGAVPLSLLQRRMRRPLAGWVAAWWRCARPPAGRAVAALARVLARWWHAAGPG